MTSEINDAERWYIHTHVRVYVCMYLTCMHSCMYAHMHTSGWINHSISRRMNNFSTWMNSMKLKRLVDPHLLTMLWRVSWSIRGQTHKRLTSIRLFTIKKLKRRTLALRPSSRKSCPRNFCSRNLSFYVSVLLSIMKINQSESEKLIRYCKKVNGWSSDHT